MNKPESNNLEALLAKAIGGLPSHINDGWVSLEDEYPLASSWLSEQVADLEQQLIKAIQQRVIDAVAQRALYELAIIDQAHPAQEAQS